tara:strand:- start:151 stop:1083 length:933 start_codon:yes stop_codon:yes gene_type:complete
MSVIVYDVTDFNSIKNNGFVYNLEQSVLDIIENIAKEVGSPEYIKTPQFIKKHDKKNVKDANWEKMRNFKVTEFAKKSEEDVYIDNIRKNLNKITTKTYDNLIKNIINDLENINNDTNVNNNELYNRIGESIFNIASTNIFYSEIYARLYKDLMDKFDFMKEIFKSNYEKFSDIYKNIEYCDSQIDYDKYCEINKTNDKRRALSKFYINLMKLEVISKFSMIELIIDIQEYLTDKLDIEANKPIVDELSEVLFIFITNSVNELSSEEKWTKIRNNVQNITELKLINYVGLTNKTVFKHMDIMDNISVKIN